jgi:hypothetical protein
LLPLLSLASQALRSSHLTPSPIVAVLCVAAPFIVAVLCVVAPFIVAVLIAA